MIKKITYRTKDGRKRTEYKILPTTYAHLSVYDSDTCAYRSHWTDMDKHLVDIKNHSVRFSGTRYTLVYSDGSYENFYVKRNEKFDIEMRTIK